MPAFQPYRGKPAVRNDREGRGNVGIIRSPVRASTLPDFTSNDDAVPKSEFWTMAPEGVSVHVSRVLLLDTQHLQTHPIQTTPLPCSPPLGPDGEQALKARLEQRSNRIPVLLTGAAAVAAFRALGVRRAPDWVPSDCLPLPPPKPAIACRHPCQSSRRTNWHLSGKLKRLSSASPAAVHSTKPSP